MTTSRTIGNWNLYEIEYRVPFLLQPGGQMTLNITYEYCLPVKGEREEIEVSKSVHAVKACETRRNISRIITASLQQKFVHIMGECDKPIYRPGERIRLRFLALNSRLLQPTAQKLQWPTHRLDVRNYSNPHLVSINQDEIARRQRDPYFDTIYVVDALGNIVQQWYNVSQLAAVTLSYSLLSDAIEGNWKIVAKVFEDQKEIKVVIKNYILPRFVANVEPPSSVSYIDETINFRVCAAYTNAEPFRGYYDAQLCVCSRRAVERQILLGKQFDNSACENTHETKGTLRSCINVSGKITPSEMNDDGCFTANATIAPIVKTSKRKYDNELAIIVNIEESDTSLVITKSVSTRFVFASRRELVLDSSNTYRKGLPISGNIQLNCSHQGPDRCKVNITLAVIEVVNPCGTWMYRSPGYSENNPTIYIVNLTTNSNGNVKFVLPPMSSTKTIRLEARVTQDNTSVTESNEKDIVSVTKSINFWSSYSGQALRVGSMTYDRQIPCPGDLNLKITANSPLAGQTIYLEFLSRGVLTRRTSVLRADDYGYACTDRDDELGHYTCNGGVEPGAINEIKCLKGWTGENCLKPECSGVECGLGGLCVAPNTCQCKQGWEGSSCDICIPRKGCLHGTCVSGLDCVCNDGYSGYLCDYAEIKYENIGARSAEASKLEHSEDDDTVDKLNQYIIRRTIFEHKAVFQMDSTFGPSLSAVVYVYSDSSDDKAAYEVVSDYIYVENLHLCSSPALEASTRDRKFGVALENLDRSKTVPGGKVGLSLKVPITDVDNEEVKSNLNPSCLVRLSDKSLQNFENSQSSLIDLKTYTNILGAQIHRGYREPSNTEQAFRAAGINFEHVSHFKEKLPNRIICPMFSMPLMREGEVLFDNVESFQAVDDRKSAPRLREFFPEVWLFDHIKLELNAKVSKRNWYYATEITAPDTITSWEFTAVCFTPNQGIWMPPRLDKETLVVSLPFYVEFTVPVGAKRQEILHLPISIFMSSTPSSELMNNVSKLQDCFEVSVAVSVNNSDWTVLGSPKFTTCLCFGAPKVTFTLAVKPRRIGKLNITAEAIAFSGSKMCNRNPTKDGPVTITDAVRRSIRITPEGIPKETTIGGVLCPSKGNIHMTEDMVISLPERIVDGSLRSYVSISGNVLGKALSNLNKLVSMPTGCGEQNMVGVAPSVYVLKYLIASTDLTNADNKKLAESAMQYIASGYKNELKYRHDNGSFSAFGPRDKHGSTWLTAFVFSVFSDAEFLLSSTELSKVKHVYLNMYDTLSSAFEFLRSTQDEDGCFREYGKVFHSQMQGSLGSAGDSRISDLLLTSYVISALHSFPKFLEETKFKSHYTIQLAEICLTELLEETKLDELSSSVLAKVAYALNGSNKNKENAQVLKTLTKLQSRMKSLSSRSGEMYWWADSIDDTATAVETTSYAFLTLVRSKPINELLPIVKWLSSQQKEQGGFYSTQDTVVALRALSIAASQLELSKSSVDLSSSDIVVTAQVYPCNAQAKTSLNKTNTHISQQFELGYSQPEEMKKISWSVKHEGQAVCVAVHYSALYNVPDPTEVDSRQDTFFSLSVTTTQTSDFTAECTHATTTACVTLSQEAIRLKSSINTGMIIMNIDIPSGWAVSDKDLQRLLEKELSRVEQDDDELRISAYFSAFTEAEAKEVDGSENLKRCVSIPFKQKVFVEALSPSLVQVMDYYKPSLKSETFFTLNTCARYWIPDTLKNQANIFDAEKTTESAVSTETTKKPSKECPICGLDVAREFVSDLKEIICNYKGNIYILVLNEGGYSQFKGPSGVLYSVAYETTIASWNSSLIIQPKCSCDLLHAPSVKKVAILTQPRAYWPGKLSVDIAGSKLISFEEFEIAFAEFSTEQLKIDPSKEKCHDLSGIQLLLRKFMQ